MWGWLPVSRGWPQALKRGFFGSGLLARVELVHFPVVSIRRLQLSGAADSSCLASLARRNDTGLVGYGTGSWRARSAPGVFPCGDLRISTGSVVG
jgi:hypothetical protein